MRAYITIFFIATFSKPYAQTLGGSAVYNFLKLPYSTQLTAAGGVNISHPTPDVSAATNNPALLSSALHAQLGVNFVRLPSGISGYDLAGAYQDKRNNTTFGVNLFFIDYGKITAADAAGNVSGTFRATDYAVQFSAGRRYLEHWQYGGSLKFIQSSYLQYHSSAVAADIGICYYDSAKGISIAGMAKNMGAQLKKYAGTAEELPFEVQFGFTKKLAKAPLAFSVSLQHMHRFNLLYRDTAFTSETGINPSASFVNKLMQHFVLAAHIFISPQLEATVGYNHLRRTDLSFATVGNGLSGFAAGFLARFEKLHISYARSSYQKGIAYNQLGLNVLLARLIGAGTF